MTLTEAPTIGCRVPLPLLEPSLFRNRGPRQGLPAGDSQRCLLPAIDHPTCLHCGAERGHEYVSLMVPCLHCPAAISWSAGEWKDSLGGTTGTGVMHKHEPDPRYL
jgi:hypothetical protein